MGHESARKRNIGLKCSSGVSGHNQGCCHHSGDTKDGFKRIIDDTWEKRSPAGKNAWCETQNLKTLPEQSQDTSARTLSVIELLILRNSETNNRFWQDVIDARSELDSTDLVTYKGS